MRRWWSFLLASTVVTAVTGCGSSAPTGVTASRPLSAPPPATTTQATSAVAAVTGPPDFTLAAKTQAGDSVTVEGRFGPALAPAQSDADPAAVRECPQSDGRELIVRLDLTTTIRSSLAADVTLDQFRSDGIADNLTEFLMGYTGGPSCQSVDGADHQVDLGTLQPHAPHQFTAWAILDDAITPNEPHPSPRRLGSQWRMDIPTIAINGTVVTEAATAGGPRVIRCTNTTAGQDDTLISITGTPPTTITGMNSERLGCTRQPVP